MIDDLSFLRVNMEVLYNYHTNLADLDFHLRRDAVMLISTGS